MKLRSSIKPLLWILLGWFIARMDQSALLRDARVKTFDDAWTAFQNMQKNDITILDKES